LFCGFAGNAPSGFDGEASGADQNRNDGDQTTRPDGRLSAKRPCRDDRSVTELN
jgi:hypothetical protein